MTEDANELRDVLEDIRSRLDADADDLEPTRPRQAFELWIDQQRSEKTDATIGSYERRVSPFLDFIENQCEIADLNDLTTRHIKTYEAVRKSAGVQTNTLNNQFGTIRLFLEYCEQLKAIHSGVVDALSVPGLTKAERVNTEKIHPQRAQTILENLDRFQYASREHVVFLLFWHTTMRIGSVRSLDVEDVYLDDDDLDRIRAELDTEGFTEDIIDDLLEDAVPPFVYPRHRPDTDTQLKNHEDGERIINLSAEVAAVLEDYIAVKRDDVQDEYGRNPLLTSQKGGGRLSTSAIRNWCYILTQPCEFGNDCPYDKDPESCRAREHGYGSKCPGSKSPHKIRTGSITYHRDRGWPPSELSQRANTSEQLIEDVYDQPEQLTRGAIRRQFLGKLTDREDSQ